MAIKTNHAAIIDLDEVINGKTSYLGERMLDLIYNNPKNFNQ